MRWHDTASYISLKQHTVLRERGEQRNSEKVKVKQSGGLWGWQKGSSLGGFLCWSCPISPPSKQNLSRALISSSKMKTCFPFKRGLNRHTEAAPQITKALIIHKTSLWVWQNLREYLNINQKLGHFHTCWWMSKVKTEVKPTAVLSSTGYKWGC